MSPLRIIKIGSKRYAVTSPNRAPLLKTGTVGQCIDYVKGEGRTVVTK